MKKEDMKDIVPTKRVEKVICGSRSDKKCFVGFDGYIDELYEVVQKRNSADDYAKCETIEAFGNRIFAAAGKSADIEIIPCKTKIGGNAPILANALATLAFDTVCVGQMDNKNEVDPFTYMNSACKKISTGEASRTIALEFMDGKIMLGDLKGNSITWDKLKEKAGFELMYRSMEESSLLCFVNWGGFYHMNEILEGIIQEILIPVKKKTDFSKDIFIDLSDPSARSQTDMEELFEIIRKMSSLYRVTLGMNENEAEKIGKEFSDCSNIKEIGEKIRANLGLYQLVIHMNHKSYGFRKGILEEYVGMYVENPVQTTGAGDHFNAGFCMGIMEEQELKNCLVLGQAMASYYIQTGITATREILSQYMEKYYFAA